MPSVPGEITVLLNQWREGTAGAFDQLIPLVYPHLRELAAAYVRRERAPGLIQPTSLVNELYLRLIAQKKADWADREHFFTFAAKVMRMILIDNARNNLAQRRGGGAEHVPLDEDIAWISVGSLDMLELDQGLEALSRIDAAKVQLIELRYFLGCTAEEAAEITKVSKATVDRELKFARSWLFRYMDGTSTQSTS
ncbi:MAG: ECF-type sigma factor [Gammaproteobacteria bacterium]